MVTSLVIVGFLIVIVFGFVLEPILRARRDRVELDSVSIPEPLPDFLAMIDDQGDDDRDMQAQEPEASQAMQRSTDPVEGHS